MTKVLFLDVDGVLNHAALPESEHPLCPDACALLRRFTSENRISIVLSSSWRLHNRAVDSLAKTAVLRAAHNDWRTVELPPLHTCRGDEIAEWLSRHPEVTHYAIVDDEPDFLPHQQDHFVHTSFRYGLRPTHIRKLAKILECKVPK